MNIKKFQPLYKFLSALLAVTLFSSTALADFIDQGSNHKTYVDDVWLDWQEDAVDSIPDFDLKRSIPIEINKTTQMKWFVDPETMSIGKDNVFRYVIVAKGPTGTLNAFYEGILCKKAEIKVYAKMISSNGEPPFDWRIIKTPEWQSLDYQSRYSHQKALAKDFVCDGAARPTSVTEVKRRMKNFKYDVSSH